MSARVGVVPPAAFHARPHLWGALEQALPVRFEPRGAGEWRGLDAVVRVGAGSAPAPLPCLDAEGDEAMAQTRGGAEEVRFATNDAGLDTRLWGATLSDVAAGAAPPLAGSGRAEPLATRGDGPLWVRLAARHERIALAPAELAEGEPLRSRLEPGRCVALLALVHFLRRVAGAHLFTAPPLRAAFIIDDPNLHWPTYGNVRYAELARDAAAHGYHVAMATVPLDGWFVHRRAARIFRQHDRQLSLVVHGCLHDGAELGAVADERAAARICADALRRTATLERRTGLRVSRVMVPPHERLSEAAAQGMLACGFEGVTMSRPYPWLEGHWLARPAEAGPLVGWGGVDEIAGGLPVLLRSALSHPREDIVLRAFLDQPLILYGHASDLAGGLDGLRAAAAQVNRVGSVRWGSLEDLVRRAVETRCDGDRMFVRQHARRARVDVPAGVRELVVTSVPGGGEPRTVRVEGPGTVELGHVERAVEAEPPRRSGAWPVLRRLVTEARDRAAPLTARL